MAVTIEKLDKATEIVHRFLEAVKDAKKRLNKDKYASFGCKETGAVRRASMDVSNILVQLRK
ncbi:hypothetical protein ACOHYD_13740 [Desulfobacterota bacterium M19]